MFSTETGNPALINEPSSSQGELLRYFDCRRLDTYAIQLITARTLNPEVLIAPAVETLVHGICSSLQKINLIVFFGL